MPTPSQRYWIDPSDQVQLTPSSNDAHGGEQLLHTAFSCTVRGQPVPLCRHRSSRVGRIYNPSKRHESLFRKCVRQVLNRAQQEQYGGSHPNQQKASSVLYSRKEIAVEMSLVFSLKRPLAHFISNKRGPGRVRQNAPKSTSASARPDIDNLVKFVLDAMSGVLYADDCQVTTLHTVKVFDDSDDCFGSTSLKINVL